MGHRALRVINEDRVAPGAGFGTHPHRDMEILSYVASGVLEHADSTGTSASIKPGELQRMSAGTGVTHSEYNGSKTEPVHFLQIWIQPSARGLEPGYAQRDFSEARRSGLTLVASGDGRDGSIAMNRDAEVYAAELDEGALTHRLRQGHGWLQLVRGQVEVEAEGETLHIGAGDGVQFEHLEGEVRIRIEEPAELLLFDLD